MPYPQVSCWSPIVAAAGLVTPESKCGWCAAIGRYSGCTAVRLNSGWRWVVARPGGRHRVVGRQRAGTGKSALALCAGLEAVLERRQHRKVVVFRRSTPWEGRSFGYLPGSENDKMGPWAQAVFDTLSAVTTPEVLPEEILDREMIEVLPLTHIRGRSLHDSLSSSTKRSL